MPQESVLLLRAPAAALHTTAVLLPLPPPPPPRASHSAARWLWPRGLSARVSPAGPLRRTRVSFTLSFLGKSVVLTSTMSSKHSYARSGERGEKREDGQQGERKSGERRGTWGKESEQTIRQNTGDRRGDPIGTRGEGKERRGERRAKREQSRTERRQVRGEKREKVRRRRRAPRNDLRERTEKVAKVVSHVNEMAEQRIDRSDLTAVTWFCPCRFAASLAAFAALAWLDFTFLRGHSPGHLRKHWAALCRRSDLTHGRNTAADDVPAASK